MPPTHHGHCQPVLYQIIIVPPPRPYAPHCDKLAALTQTKTNRQRALSQNAPRLVCECDALLVRLLAVEDPAAASVHLQNACGFAKRSGSLDLQLRSFHSQCELYRQLGDYSEAFATGNAGVELADQYG